MKAPLLIAEAANPEWTSVPLVGWQHSRAVQRLVGGHLVTQVRNRGAIERAGADPGSYTVIDSERVAGPLNRLASLVRGGSGKGWTTVTALQALAYPAFERGVWREFGARLRSGEFSLVHRITPLSPTIPSLLAGKLAGAGVPFVIGPLNGGVAWPRQFDGARRREREWLSYVRGLYRLLPGYRSTRRHASAIVCGSRATMEQMPGWSRERCVYIPENGVEPSKFPAPGPKPEPRPLRVAFIGRLVPYKGADMLLEAAAGLVRSGRVEVDIIGDGPEMGALKALVSREGLGGGVEFAGWVAHERLHERLARAHVFGFPSVREFGGAVVLEAMAMGLVPLVLNYGGPGEVGGERVTRGLEELAGDGGRLAAMGAEGRRRVMRLFTWDAKARQTREVYGWVLGARGRPSWEEFESSGWGGAEAGGA